VKRRLAALRLWIGLWIGPDRLSYVDRLVAFLLIRRWGTAVCDNCGECMICGMGAQAWRPPHVPNCPGTPGRERADG